jgi:hypothetical protein
MLLTWWWCVHQGTTADSFILETDDDGSFGSGVSIHEIDAGKFGGAFAEDCNNKGVELLF